MAKKAIRELPPKKSGCMITREKFMENATPLTLSVAGRQEILTVKEFSTRSFGWSFNGKIVIEVDGIPLKVQANINLVVVGSREAK